MDKTERLTLAREIVDGCRYDPLHRSENNITERRVGAVVDAIKSAVISSRKADEKRGYLRGKADMVEELKKADTDALLVVTAAYKQGWDEALREAKTAILQSGCEDGSIHTEAIRLLIYNKTF